MNNTFILTLELVGSDKYCFGDESGSCRFYDFDNAMGHQHERCALFHENLKRDSSAGWKPLRLPQCLVGRWRQVEL